MTHAALRKSLLAWYRAHRRDLPWRRTRDPYAIWISEAMLQQTRVETVVDYWSKFLARFPDVASLAAASEDEVLAAWSGLGYYRRARALREAARAIVERHGGEFPSERAAALALPGIGPYTAGAVLSIAFDRREPLVDGNVARVFSRWFALEDELGSSESSKRTWELARELLPVSSSPGEWNQALMELGATLCAPREPRCKECPMTRSCAAFRERRVRELPRPKSRPEVVEVELEVLLVQQGGARLLQRRPHDAARMAGMWELPTREVGTKSGLFPPAWEPEGGFVVGRELARVRHTITKHRIAARVREARVERGTLLSPRFRWVAEGETARVALTGMARKVLARC